MNLALLWLLACGGSSRPAEICEPLSPGWEQCWLEGDPRPVEVVFHRVPGGVCADDPADLPPACGSVYFAQPETCESDADCDGDGCFSVGLCGGCNCATLCTADADCGSGEICVCAGRGISNSTFCRPAECTGPDDCGGEACALARDGCGWGYASTQCRSERDECRYDTDCKPGSSCMWVDDRFACSWYAVCDC